LFFPERIKCIKNSDKVLEIGPGSSPFVRSDVLLDKKFDDKEALKQRGNQPKIEYTKPIYYYNGLIFPFKDKEFDYVICSQVLEHVPSNELDNFIKEVERVAKRGYIEVPRLFYDYLFNFYEHKWLINFKKGKLLLLDKAKVEFTRIQDIFYLMFKYGKKKKKITLIKDFIDFFMIGYEWEDKIEYKIVNSLNELISDEDVAFYKNYFMSLEEKPDNIKEDKSLARKICDKIRNKIRKTGKNKE